MLKRTAIIAIFILGMLVFMQIKGLIEASAWEYRSFGSFDYWDCTSFYDPVEFTKVNIILQYGDSNAWKAPRSVKVKWDNRAVAVSDVTIHLIGVFDDKNRLIEVFADASAGGTGAKTETYCTVGTDICYVYENRNKKRNT